MHTPVVCDIRSGCLLHLTFAIFGFFSGSDNRRYNSQASRPPPIRCVLFACKYMIALKCLIVKTFFSDFFRFYVLTENGLYFCANCYRVNSFLIYVRAHTLYIKKFGFSVRFKNISKPRISGIFSGF